MTFEVLAEAATVGVLSITHVVTVALVAEVSDLYRAGSVFSVARDALCNHKLSRFQIRWIIKILPSAVRIVQLRVAGVVRLRTAHKASSYSEGI